MKIIKIVVRYNIVFKKKYKSFKKNDILFENLTFEEAKKFFKFNGLAGHIQIGSDQVKFVYNKELMKCIKTEKITTTKHITSTKSTVGLDFFKRKRRNTDKEIIK